MALTKISTAMISQDAASVDLNIDAGTLYIDSTNNRVGVGTTSPVFALHVHQTSNSQIHFTDNTSGSNVGDGLRVGWNGTVGQMWLFEEAALRFATNNTERVRIDSSGNLLISKTNTTFSTTGIELRAGNGGSRFIRSNAEPILLNRTGSDGKIIGVYKDGSEVGSIFTDNSGDLGIGNDDTGLLFVGGSDLIAPWNPTGPASRDAVISLGNASNRFNNLYMAGTLYGPATFTIDPATHGDNTGTVVIAGNLQVDGTTTTINSTTLTVDDKLITLASGSANAAAANGAGIEVEISGATNPSLTYDGTNDQWDFNKNVNTSGTVSAARLRVNRASASSDPAFIIEGLNNTNGTVQIVPNSNKGSNQSHIHHGSTGDWYIRSASNSGTVYIQDSGGTLSTGPITITGATLVKSGNTLTLNRTDNAIGGAMSYVQGTGFLLNDANGDGFSYNVGANNKVRFTPSGAINSIGNIVNDIGNSGDDSYIELKNTGYTGNVTSLRQNADSLRSELNATERSIHINAASGGGNTSAEVRLYANQQLGFKLDANKATTFYGTANFSGAVTTTQINLNSASYDNRQIGMDSNGFFIYNAADSRYDLKISDSGVWTFANTANFYGNGAAPLVWGNTSGVGALSFSGSNAIVRSTVSNADLIFQGNSSGLFTALTLDMSEAGDATFNRDVLLLGDNHNLRIGADQDLMLFFDGTDAVMRNITSNSDIRFRGNDDGSTIDALRLDMSNAGRAYFSAGASFNGNINANDNEKLILGTHDDLSVFHDGSDSFITNATGQLILRVASVESALVAKPNAAVELYYDNTKRFETAPNGVIVKSTPGVGSAADIDFLSTNTSGFGSSYAIDSRIRSTTEGSSNAYSSKLQFYTNDSSNNLTERMQLNGSGDWIVSNTNPRVASQFTNQAGIGWYDADLHAEVATTNNRSALEIGKNNANDGDLVTFRKQSDVVGDVGTIFGDLYIGTGDTKLRFDDTNDAITPRGSGGSARNSAISLGTSSVAFRSLNLSAADPTTSATSQIRFITQAGSNLADAAITASDDSGGTDLLLGSNFRWHSGTLTRFDSSRSGSGIRLGYTGNMRFYTESSSNQPTERMVLDSVGNLLLYNGSPEFHFGTTSASHYNWRVAAQEAVDGGFEIASGTQSAGSGAAGDSYTTRFHITGSNGFAKLYGPVGIVKNPVSTVSLSVAAQSTSNSSYGLEVTNGSSNTRFLVDGTGNSWFYKTDNAVGMKWDSVNGRLGIGTTSPGTPLTISNLDNGTGFSSNRVLQLIGTSTTDGSRISLAFTGNTSVGNGLAIIEAVNDDQSAGHTSLHMHTYNGSWNTENLVLKGGKVGISTASPDYPLHLINPSDSNQMFRVLFPDANFTEIGTSRMSTGNTQGLFINAQTDIKFGSGSTETARLTSTGKLGIGTDSPEEKLDVSGEIHQSHSNAESKTFPIHFSSGTTHSVTTISNTDQSTAVVATFEFIGVYSYAGSNMSTGKIMAATRRSSSNTAWTNRNNVQITVTGDLPTNNYPNSFFWDNGVLKVTTDASHVYTGTLTISYYNCDIS